MIHHIFKCAHVISDRPLKMQDLTEQGQVILAF